MVIKELLRATVLLSLVLGLVGCVSSGAKRNKNAAEVRTAGVGAVDHFYGEPVVNEEQQSLLATKTIYFDFDQFEISEESKQILFAHAEKLLKNPNLQLRIDGHTDERGSREYNIGLGERRAKAVSRVLALKGIPADRVTVVSYGKEQPAKLDHDEVAWKFNRRAELHYEDLD